MTIYRITDAFLAQCDPIQCGKLVCAVLQITKPEIRLENAIEQTAHNALKWQEIYSPMLSPIEREVIKEIIKLSPPLPDPSFLEMAPEELIPAITATRDEFLQLSQSGFYPSLNMFKLRLLNIIENLITMEKAPKAGKLQIEVEDGPIGSFKEFMDAVFADCIEGQRALQIYLQKGQQAQTTESPELDEAFFHFSNAKQKIEALQKELRISCKDNLEPIKLELAKIVHVLQKEHRKWLLPIELQPLSFFCVNGHKFNSASITMLKRSAKVAYFCMQFFIRQKENKRPPKHLVTSWPIFITKLQKLLLLVDESMKALAPLQEIIERRSLMGNSSDFVFSVQTTMQAWQVLDQRIQAFADTFYAHITGSKDKTINSFADAAPYAFSIYCLPLVNLFMLCTSNSCATFMKYWKDVVKSTTTLSSSLALTESSELIYFDKFFWWQKGIFDLLAQLQKDTDNTKQVTFAKLINDYLRFNFHVWAILYLITDNFEQNPTDKSFLDIHTQCAKQTLKEILATIEKEASLAPLKTTFQMLDQALIDPYVLLVLNDSKGAKIAVKKRQDFGLFSSFFKQLKFLAEFINPVPFSLLQHLEQVVVPQKEKDLMQDLLNELHLLAQAMERFKTSCKVMKTEVQTMEDIQRNFAIILSQNFSLKELLVSSETLVHLCVKEWTSYLATNAALNITLSGLQKSLVSIQQDIRALISPWHRLKDKNPAIAIYTPPPLPVLQKPSPPEPLPSPSSLHDSSSISLEPLKTHDDTTQHLAAAPKDALEALIVKSHLVLVPIDFLDDQESTFRQAQIQSSWGNLQILATSLFPLLEIAETDLLQAPYALSTQLQLKSALVLEQVGKLALSYFNIRNGTVHVLSYYRSEHDLERLFLELTPILKEHNLSIDQSTLQNIANLKNVVKIASRYPIYSYSPALQEMQMLSDILYSMRQQSLSLAEEEFLQKQFPACSFDQLEPAIKDKQKMILKNLQVQGRQCLEFVKTVLKCLPYTLEALADASNPLPPTHSTISTPAFPYDSMMKKVQQLKEVSEIFLQNSFSSAERKLYLIHALRNFPFYLTALRELYSKPNTLPLLASIQEQKLFFEALLLEQTFIAFLTLLPIHNLQNTSEHVLSTRISENRVLAFSHDLEQFLNLTENFLNQKGQTLNATDLFKNRVKFLGRFLQTSMRYPYEENDAVTTALGKARQLSSLSIPSTFHQQTMVKLFGNDEDKWEREIEDQKDAVEELLLKESYLSFEFIENMLNMLLYFFK